MNIGFSCAHFNPAVTIALYISGEFSAVMIVPYIVVQCLGSVLGAAMAQVNDIAYM